MTWSADSLSLKLASVTSSDLEKRNDGRFFFLTTVDELVGAAA